MTTMTRRIRKADTSGLGFLAEISVDYFIVTPNKQFGLDVTPVTLTSK